MSAVAGNPFAELARATHAARLREPHIGTVAKRGCLVIVRAEPRKGRSHAVTELSGPLSFTDAVAALQRFAAGGAL